MVFSNNEQVNEIRNKADIVEIISSYITLSKKGKNFFGICPFHDDHSPSMSVSREKQIFTCFTCHVSGNVFNFVQNYENVSFFEAVSIVANKIGLNFQYYGGGNDYKDSSNKPLYDAYEVAEKFYQNNINTSYGKEAKDYLKKRGFSDDIIREFKIGLSLKTTNMLSKLLLNKKNDVNLIVDGGLVSKNEYGVFDMFHDRIMFPLWDLQGRPVAFSGRIYQTNDGAKYVNTRETDIFKKGELLYNYHRAKDETRKKNEVIVMEGFMDVIASYAVDIKNCVATMGTAITKQHAKLLKRMANQIILCFDGDEAGGKATENAINELRLIGVSPKVVRLEDGLDPDEYIKKYGKDIFLDKLEHPINVIDFELNYLKMNKDLTSNVEYSKYLNLVLQKLAKDTDDTILQELTLAKLSEESKVEISVLRKKLNEILNNYQVIEIEDKSVKKSPVIQKFDRYQKAEQNLLYYMLDNKSVILKCRDKVGFLSHKKYRNLVRKIIEFYDKNGYISSADLLTDLQSDNEELATLFEILNLNIKDEFTSTEIEDYLKVIYEGRLEEQNNKLLVEIKQEALNSKKVQLAEQILEIKKKKEENR